MADEKTVDSAAKPAPKPAMVSVKMPDGITSVSVAGMLLEVKNGVVKCEHWVAAHLKEAFGATDAK